MICGIRGVGVSCVGDGEMEGTEGTAVYTLGMMREGMCVCQQWEGVL